MAPLLIAVEKAFMPSSPIWFELNLNGNQIGNAGMSAFAGAIGASGAMAKLTYLGLGENQIGNEGMQALRFSDRQWVAACHHICGIVKQSRL